MKLAELRDGGGGGGGGEEWGWGGGRGMGGGGGGGVLEAISKEEYFDLGVVLLSP